MMRSLFSGISGLRNHQTRMDVIGNNVSNVNTTGFKASRTIFQDIFSQTLSGGMAHTGISGGTNPTQVGLGIRLSTIDVMHTGSPFGRTDNPFDMMIENEGFFIVQDPTGGHMFTRVGNFGLDSEGFLVTGEGMFVLGFGPTPDQIEFVPAQPAIPQFTGTPRTDDPIDLAAADPNDRGGWVLSQGEVVRLAYIEGGANVDIWGNAILPGTGWQVGLEGVIPGGLMPGFTSDPDEQRRQVGAFDPTTPDAYVPGWEDGNATRPATQAMPASAIFPPQDQWDMDNLQRIQLRVHADPDGPNAGEYADLLGFSVGNNGTISVVIRGVSVPMAQVGLALFANNNGLERAGNSLWRQTASSGDAVITRPMEDGAGTINGGGLEMSNVDLASEFTEMIITQRGYQANSRIITVSDSLLEELVNLKR